MATSGSIDYNSTLTEIIEDVLSSIGVVGADYAVSYSDFLRVKRCINDLLKEWNAAGLHLWCKTEGVLFLTPSTSQYTINASSAKAAKASDTVVTEVATAASSSDTTLVVDSTSGMTASDYIGVELDDDTTHWTTISSITNSTTLELTDALTDDVAVDNNVYTFTTKIDRPTRILRASSVTGISTPTEIPMRSLGRTEYFNMATKTVTGQPTQFYYDPQLSTGELYIWPVPSDSTVRINFTYERPIEDLDSGTDNPDIPQEWLSTLKAVAAVRIAGSFGRGVKVREDGLDVLAAQLEEKLLGFDRGRGSIKLRVAKRK